LWRVYPDGGCYDTSWLKGFWFIQAKVEGTVPRDAWHCGRESIVVNDHLGEPGRSPFYVELPPAWGSFDGDDLMFFPIL